MGRKDYPRKQKNKIIFFKYREWFKGANKEVLHLINWIEEFNNFFGSKKLNNFFVLLLMRHLKTGCVGLIVFSQTILIYIYKFFINNFN